MPLFFYISKLIAKTKCDPMMVCIFTTESNLEALRLINSALAMNDFDFVEALAEKGLILIRMGEVSEARDVFQEYKTAASGMPQLPPGRDATWANRMLIKCDQLMLKR